MPCPLAEQGTFCNKSGKYAAPGLGCHRCYSAIVEKRTKGEVISNPGRRLAPCVAPYFADRGVGDMRGPPMGAPKMPPRRRWQAVIAPHDPTSHTRDTQHVARNTMAKATAPHHLRGAIWVGHHHALPACRHDPAWRNTGLRTAATPRGVAEMSAFCHRLRRQRCVRAEAPAPGCSPLRSTAPPLHRLVPRSSLLSNP